MIPVRNVFYLLSYAWDAVDLVDERLVGELGPNDVAALLAKLLLQVTRDVMRRGLDRGYVERRDEVVGVRGRIAFGATTSHLLLPRARTVCDFDELSHDIPANRLVKASLRAMANVDGLAVEIREELHDLCSAMSTVADLRLSPGAFDRIVIHRNNRRYGLLIDLCRLASESVLVDDTTGLTKFLDFRDEEKMSRVFESFVRRFYQRHATGFTVTRPRFAWSPATGSPEDLKLLPTLETDLALIRDGTCLIVDTKYYRQPLVRNRVGAEKVRSDSLNQIYAYVRNVALTNRYEGVEGMLLYACVDRSLRLDVTIHGQRIRIASVNLADDSLEIHRELLQLLVS